jgi:thymidylate synthase (FAD)
MKAQYEDHFGDDLKVVNMAKVSFDRLSGCEDWQEIEFETYSGGSNTFQIPTLYPRDQKLIRYLATGFPSDEWEDILSELMGYEFFEDVETVVNKIKNAATHWAPFSHCSVTLKMEAPVPIRTQCFKHKVGFNESEESRRYISSKPVLYIPEYFAYRPKNVKQGAAGPHPESDFYLEMYKKICNQAIDAYMHMVETIEDENGKIVKHGVAPEQARFILPQGCEVHWFWTGSLAAWARYYNQRTDSHAQKENRILAEEVGQIIEQIFPISWRELTR